MKLFKILTPGLESLTWQFQGKAQKSTFWRSMPQKFCCRGGHGFEGADCGAEEGRMLLYNPLIHWVSVYRPRSPGLLSWLLSIPNCHHPHSGCHHLLHRLTQQVPDWRSGPVFPSPVHLLFFWYKNLIRIVSGPKFFSISPLSLKPLRRANKQGIHITTGSPSSLTSCWLASLLTHSPPSIHTSHPRVPGTHQAPFSTLTWEQVIPSHWDIFPSPTCPS